MKRHKYVVQERGDHTVVETEGAIVQAYLGVPKRTVASIWGSKLKRYFYEFGQLSELYVRRKDGTLSDARSFGKDPVKTKG